MSTPALRAAERYYQYVCDMPDDVSDAEAIARGVAIIDEEFAKLTTGAVSFGETRGLWLTTEDAAKLSRVLGNVDVSCYENNWTYRLEKIIDRDVLGE